MRFGITIEYLGKNYCGWQRQENALSIQEVLEEKLAIVLQQKVILFASGRTDSGVHALGQVAHFDADTKLSCDKIMLAVNSMLPIDISVISCYPLPDDFHAQYSAKLKTYIYKCYVSRKHSPLREGYYVRIIPPLDMKKMREACKLLIGEHDFKAFSSSKQATKTTIRRITKLEITQKDDEIIFEVEGNGFLFNMVRIIVGTLVYIGKGRLPVENITQMLNGGKRILGGKTFPPQGLYLARVEYPAENNDA